MDGDVLMQLGRQRRGRTVTRMEKLDGLGTETVQVAEIQVTWSTLPLQE